MLIERGFVSRSFAANNCNSKVYSLPKWSFDVTTIARARNSFPPADNALIGFTFRDVT